MNGKAIARDIKGIEKVTKALDLPDIHDLTSFAALAAEFDVDPDLPAAQEKWFEASQGLRWVRAVRAHIAAHPPSVKNAAAVLADLDRFEEVLAGAQRVGAKWHFEMDM